MNRRHFLKVAGVSTAAAAAQGCSTRRGPDKVIAYPASSETNKPGISTEFATVCRECPAGCGLIAIARDGRAIKVDGNPDHPINAGKLCLRGQSSLQGLYNPDRLRGPLARDEHGRLAPISWEEAEKRLDASLGSLNGKSVAWIGQVETGAFDRLTDAWLAAVAPSSTRIRYETYAYEPLRAAAGAMLGQAVIPRFRIDEARTLICFGADFLETWLSNVEYARQFGEWRRARTEGKHHGRYVFIGPRLSLTGANADEWIAVRPGAEEIVARALSLLAAAKGRVPAEAASLAESAGVPVETLSRLAREFASGPSLALPPGSAQDGPRAVAVHEAVLRLNQAVGNVGRTVLVDAPHALSTASRHQETMSLVSDMREGKFGALFVHRANPVYALPPSAGFAEALKSVPEVISFSSYPDETTALATLVLPDHTPLESWGEYSPRSGVNGLMQPAVAPVFDTRATGDVLLASAARAGHNLGAAEFREYLRKEHGGDDAAWAALLQLGGAFSEPAPTPARAAAPLSAPSGPAPVPVAPADGRLVLHIYPSLHFYDGRTANRPWAQEIPDPMAKAVWGSWAEIHPDAAKRFGVQDGDVMALETAAGRIEAPALLTDRVVSGVVAIQRGQGHTNLGRFADGIGVNPLALLPAVVEPASGALVVSGGDVAVRKLAVRRPPVVLQTSMKQVGAAIARAVTVAQLAWTRRKGGLNGEGGEEEGPLRGRKNPSLYANAQHPKHHWGMAIDLDTCLGCNACVASCYAENNVPVVGREGCSRGREMSWLRIENYTEEGASGLLRIQAKKPADTGPRTNLTRFFPMLCQQCDNAPCEYVCPVDATVHSSEGLNMQVYNRCVGTRYCSNNCPYKVRRFNFFPPAFEPPLDQQLNPEVTVRSKGVMEKCTFCIQRIEAGKVQAKAEGRPVRDGEIRTACQNACPTDAIVFGDLKDENSRAAQLAKGARGYGALEELNTLPNVTYLARVRAE